MKKRLGTIALVLALVLAALPASRAAPAAPPTYTVTSKSDSGAGSLREAIDQANGDGGVSVINFAIPGTGVHIIKLLSPLPALTEGGTIIDGYSQPGAAPATAKAPATIVIEIDGTSAGPGDGLSIKSADNLVMGLAINRFDGHGIVIAPLLGIATTGNDIRGNHIGIDAAGTVDRGNDYGGVYIRLGAQENTVGGSSPDRRNVISGNGEDGVRIRDTSTMSNTVAGNYIGTAANGTDALGNDYNGVYIDSGARGNLIGGNVISGNGINGVSISDEGTRGNTVSDNYIGTTAAGTADLGNGGDGVAITDGAHDNTIGPGNEIAHNGDHGVFIFGTSTMGNTVSGNKIHSNWYGVVISGAQNNTVGGGAESERNVIVGNDEAGIRIVNSAQNNTISGNYIGVKGAGVVRPNGDDGVEISLAHHNTIGPDNVISGNDGYGVYVEDAQDNTIFGNYIGTDVHGMASAGFGNSGSGIYLDASSTDNTIGGATTAEGNLIYGNGGHGVHVGDDSATGNRITHNSIEYNVGKGIKLSGLWTSFTPIIAATTPGSVYITGMGCVDCYIEVFQSHLDSGEGLTFVGETSVDSSGNFTVTVDSLPPGAPYLTATATKANNTTSQFSEVFESTISSVYLPLVLR